MLKKIFCFLRPRANQRNPFRGLRLEQFEARNLMTVWEPSQEYIIRSNFAESVPGLVAGQLVKIEATFIDDDPGTLQQASISFDGRTLNFDSIDNQRSVVHSVSTTTLQFSGGLGSTGGLSAGDFVRLIVAKEKLSNLVALPPSLAPDGDVNLGYRIDGSASVPIRFRDRAYVEIELFYARGPGINDIINQDKRIASFSLESIPREEIYTVPTVPSSKFQEYPPEPGTTHLLVVIDRKDKAVEFSDSDNVRAIRLPNITALTPRLKSDGSAEIGYRVTNPPFVNGAEGREVTVQAWYSKTSGFDGKIGTASLYRVPMDPNQSNSTYVSVPAAVLGSPPAGAKFLLTRVDNADLVRESNESDNVASLALPDLQINSVAWDGTGGATVKVTISNSANLPTGWDPGLSLHWSSDGQVPDLSGASGIPALPRAALRRIDQEQTIRFVASRLPTLTPRQIEQIGVPATHLLALLDIRGTVAEASEANNKFALELPVLSHELSDAPAAATKLERAKLWLQKYRGIINSEAELWNVEARAIGGVIAWEAAVGPARSVTEVKFPFRRWNGPGKVHYKESHPLGAILGQTDPDPIVVRELESLGILPKVTDEERARIVATPAGAIRYIAAYLSAFANVYEQYGFNVRKVPGALATLYNGSGYQNLTAAFEALPSRDPAQRPRPDTNPKFAGYWVHRNTEFLKQALKTKTAPKDGLINYAPITDRNYVATSGTPLVIPIADLLGTNATELVGVLPRQSPLMPRSITADNANVTYTADFVGTTTFFFSVRVSERVIYGGKVTVTVAPPAPTDLTATSELPTQVRLAWRGVEAASSYRIERTSGPAWQAVANVAADQSTWTGSDHTPDSAYGYRVTAIAVSGLESLPSSAAWVTTQRGTPDSPKNLRAVSVSARNVQVRWDEVRGEDFYIVEVSTDGGASWRLQENVPADHAYEANLTVQPGSNYLFRVVAMNGYGRSLPSNQIVVSTPHLPPGNPSNLRLSNVWARFADITWNAASGLVLEYRIAMSRDGANWDNIGVVAANSTGFRVENLNPGTRYLFKVRAANGEGYSEYSNTIDVTTRIEPPAAPGNLRVANLWARTIDLNWDDQSNNETEFRIAISRDGGANWDNIGVVAANSTGFRVENLNPGTRYLFKVRAANGEGYSEYSNTIDVITRIEPPAAPGNLRVANLWARTIDLNWDDLSSNETEFRIAVSRDGGANWDNIGVLAANSTGFRVENLNPGTRYLFKVRAANGEGYSEYGNTIDVTTRIEPPAAPSNLRVANLWARTIDLNWDDLSNNETEFRIAISRDGGANWDNIGVLAANSTSFRVENLNPGTRYLFKVRAANGEGYSEYSNTIDVTTRIEPPAAPSNLRVANLWARTIDLNWDDLSNNETEFRIAISRDGGANWTNVAVTGVNATSFRIENLNPNTRYLFKVRAANSEGFSDYSNTLDVRTRA